MLETRVKRELHALLYQTKPHSNHSNDSTKRIRTKINREFQNLIVIYNNVLSFCSEAAKVDYKHSVFNTFRCMSDIKHLLESLLSNLDDNSKFCQIYHNDSSQEQLKRRLNDDIDDNVLEGEILRMLQRLMKNINSYAKIFKSCGQRIQKNSHLMTKIQLKQNEFNRLIKETHNKSTSNEMIVVIIMLENLKRDQSIERDLLIQNIDDDLLSILY